ncbi:MAG: HYR domain-containing protein [Gemmatimonadales bacterium]
MKQAYYASLAENSAGLSGILIAPAHVSATVLSGSSCSGNTGDAPAYTKAAITFAPQADPVNAVTMPRDADDGWIADMPIGFDFQFYGNTYSKLNLYLNGFITFGVGENKPFWTTDAIPVATSPNNMIAFSWNDWFPGKVPGSVRYETRGSAPNRQFLIQFRAVPEALGSGKLTALIVLSEGTNAIEIHTSTMNMTYLAHRNTQGIENADGTVAVFDSALTPAGQITPRVRGVFTLTNDALRFSPVVAKDEVSPTITAPANISRGNDPGLASAIVSVGSADAADNCGEVSVTSVRSDGAALDAPYPVGITTITWTAKDAAGNSASATQTVTVLDIEAPVFGQSRSSGSMVFNATSPTGAVVSYGVAATDNVGVTSLSCLPASGSVFSNGNTTVYCTARDAAGNSSSKEFVVTVLSARQQLASLIEIVTGLKLPNGTAQPLLNQLKSAYSDSSSGATSCKKLDDFIHLVETKARNFPDPDDATMLVDEATRIMGALGCGTATPSAAASLTRIAVR